MCVDKPESWTIEHFSQANPSGARQGDVAALLRRIADTIEKHGAIQVQDLIMVFDATPDGIWPSITVYFHRGRDLRAVT